MSFLRRFIAAMHEWELSAARLSASAPIRFIAAMHEWELSAARLSASARTGPNEADPALWALASRQMDDELAVVLQQFCGKATPRGGVTYAVPPSHDPESERVLEIRPTRTGVRIVTRRQTGFTHTLVYTLRRTKDGWRLLDNRTRLAADGSETPWNLCL